MAGMIATMEAKTMYEVWVDITGYEGKYQISNKGKVRSLDYHRQGIVKELALKNSRGYLIVGLTKNAKKTFYSVHRLVANAFIPNPLKLPQVNHIDTNKMNNSISNLEWVTAQDNTVHAINHGCFDSSIKKLKNANEQRAKPVVAINLATGSRRYFISLREMSRTLNIDRKQIVMCLNGKYEKAKGFRFEYGR